MAVRFKLSFGCLSTLGALGVLSSFVLACSVSEDPAPAQQTQSSPSKLKISTSPIGGDNSTEPPSGSDAEQMDSGEPPPMENDGPIAAPVFANLADLLEEPASVVATIHPSESGVGIEGPVWHPQGFLLFSSVDRKEIWKWTPGASPVLFRSSALQAGARRSNGLTFEPSTGDLVVCEDGDAGMTGFGVGRYASQRPGALAGSRSSLVHLSTDGKRFHGPNDCIVDSQGQVYFTDPWYGASRGGSNDLGSVYGLYVRSPQGSVSLISADFNAPASQTPYAWEVGKGSPNGLALSPDESKLYVAVTALNSVFVFTRSGQGHFQNKAVFSSNVVSPDGLKVDEGGLVYVATKDGIVVLKPDGATLGTIALPAASGIGSVGASNVAFGGADFKTLFATADGNKIYRIRLKAKGARPWAFSSTLPATLSQ